jgi:hypothetical protein
MSIGRVDRAAALFGSLPICHQPRRAGGPPVVRVLCGEHCAIRDALESANTLVLVVASYGAGHSLANCVRREGTRTRGGPGELGGGEGGGEAAVRNAKELVTRGNLELGEDLAEMVLSRARADEEL